VTAHELSKDHVTGEQTPKRKKEVQPKAICQYATFKLAE
jgi:hypothetical protein